MNWPVLFSCLAALALACSSGGGGGSDASTDATTTEAGAATCTFDLDCPNAGDSCFFAVSGGCTVAGRTGKCMAFTAPASCTPTVACGCDGTTISVCAPAGFVDRASMGPGPCAEDAGSDVAADSSPE